MGQKGKSRGNRIFLVRFLRRDEGEINGGVALCLVCSGRERVRVRVRVRVGVRVRCWVGLVGCWVGSVRCWVGLSSRGMIFI